MSNELTIVEDLQKKIVKKDKATIRKAIMEFERRLDEHPTSVKDEDLDNLCPVKHTFVDGAYVREIRVPKGTLLTTKIHKICHPYFVMKGECSVITEDGEVRVKAPYSGITPAWTKRIVYVHEDTIWVTVHVTKEKDLEKIEQEIIAGSFDEISIDHDDKFKLKEG